MLILDRGIYRHDEERATILIRTPEGREIKIVVISTRPYNARIGIEADDDVRIIRMDAKCQDPKRITTKQEVDQT